SLVQHLTHTLLNTLSLHDALPIFDRENPYSENACDSFHPAVIKSLTRVAEAAKIYGTEVSVCGEMASNPQATPILLNLGIRKLSVTSLSIPFIKEKIRKQVIKPSL